MLPLAIGVGPVDIAIVAGVVLLLFGGSKLASFGKGAGDAIREFKKASSDDDVVVAPAAQPAVKPKDAE